MTDIAVMDANSPGPRGSRPTGFAELLQRVKAEFLEMPGLTVTYDQAVKLWACHPVVCREVLETLVQTRFLVRTRRAAFARNE
jgi:hypothetical protein